MPHTSRKKSTIRTTLGDLTAAYYEAALAELKDPAAAADLARVMVSGALRRRSVELR